MRARLKILLVLLSVALNVAFVGSWTMHAIRASEGQRPARATGGPSAAMPSLYEQVGTTKDQWQQIRPQLETFRASALAVFERINQRRQEMLVLLAAPQADHAGIAEKQKEIRAAQAQMQELVTSHILAEKEILTPPQRQRYFELLAQRSGTLCENLMEGLRPERLEGGSRKRVVPRE